MYSFSLGYGFSKDICFLFCILNTIRIMSRKVSERACKMCFSLHKMYKKFVWQFFLIYVSTYFV